MPKNKRVACQNSKETVEYANKMMSLFLKYVKINYQMKVISCSEVTWSDEQSCLVVYMK
jgi:hypothetical protein